MNSDKVVRNSFIYIASNILLKAFNFLLLPLYTAYLTTQDYGITNLVSTFANFATYIVAFSLYSAVISFYADLKSDSEKIRRFFGTVICFVACSGAAFLIIACLLRKFLVLRVLCFCAACKADVHSNRIAGIDDE